MDMMNPECCEVPMWLELTAELVFNYYPGSPEIRQLFLAAQRHPRMWVCLDCYRFFPATVTPTLVGHPTR